MGAQYFESVEICSLVDMSRVDELYNRYLASLCRSDWENIDSFWREKIFNQGLGYVSKSFLEMSDTIRFEDSILVLQILEELSGDQVNALLEFMSVCAHAPIWKAFLDDLA